MEQMINEFKEALKENLLSVIRFGTEGQPNNFLFVVKKLDFLVLQKIKPLVIAHKKRTEIVPLFFTQEELMQGADVFPLEFLDIKYPHTVLYGEDVVEKIKFDKKHVRRQIEFELRSKLIHLREHFIWVKKPRELEPLLSSAVPNLMPLFYGLLFLKDTKPPTELDALFKAVEDAYRIDVSILKKARALSKQKARDEELGSMVKELMEFLASLGSQLDRMKF